MTPQEPWTAAGRALLEPFSFYEDPPPGYGSWTEMILAIEREAAAAAQERAAVYDCLHGWPAGHTFSLPGEPGQGWTVWCPIHHNADVVLRKRAARAAIGEGEG